MMALTTKQLGLLHVAKKQLGLDEESYRALLWGAAGVESAKELDARGFDAVVDTLRQLGFVPRTRGGVRQDFGDREGMATRAQLGKIRALWRAYSDNDDDKKLSKWLSASFQVSAVRFLDQVTATKAIEALKRMSARPRRQEAQDG